MAVVMATDVEPLPTAVLRMAELVECLCQEVGADVCYCGPYFGGDTPFDYCSECDGGLCGQAWVRLVSVYPSATFPTQDLSGNCTMPLAYEWEIGVARCAPTIGDDGSAPSRDENLEATVQQYTDMVAMRRAIACCFASQDIDYILGPYSPAPVLGGCLAGTWQVFSR